MPYPRFLLPLVFLALTSTFGCQTIPGSATVEIPAAENPRDAALSKSMLDRLLAYNKADLSGISVVSNNGKVYLGGTVKSLEARQQALRIAWHSPGVQSVVNRLEVQH